MTAIESHSNRGYLSRCRSGKDHRERDVNALVVLRRLLTFALIFATGALGYALPHVGSRVSLLLLPSGLAVAALFRWGWRTWPALFAGGVAIELSAHQPIVAAIGVGIGLAGGSALTVWILTRRNFDPDFSHDNDVPLFIAAAAAGMALMPTLGYLGYALSGITAKASNPVNWIRWWVNAAAGVLLVAPGLIALNRNSLVRFRQRWIEGTAWIGGVALCCAAIFTAPGELGRPIIFVFSMLLIAVSTIRFGLVVSAAGAFAMSVQAAYCFAFDRGVFAQVDELQGLVLIWSFVASLSGVSLIITALLAERDAAALETLRAEQRYAQIFNDSPQPIWVHDPVSLRFLMFNEAAVRQYGWSREEILSMSVQALLPPGASFAPASEDGATEPFEMQHLTRGGRLLEVEVWTRSINLGGQRAELVFAFDVTERRAFGSALIEAIAGEQRRIGQEMHDGLGQELTGLALSARALANRAERERDAIAGELDELASLASSCIQDARLIVQGLSPLTDAEGSLESALEALARRSSLSGTEVRFHARNEAQLTVDLKVRNHLYRIAQEAVQNALKHSGAHAIDIDLRAHERSVVLEIVDDGCGVPTEGVRGQGLGMRTMRFRASAIGGRLTIARRPGGGNSVICEALQTRER
jgi:PAS domain S-box-containing protein